MSAQTTVRFRWAANTEPDITGYNLYIGNFPRTYSQSLNVGLVTNYTLAGLVPGTTYYFALTALNTSGLESDFTPELTYQVPVIVTNAPPNLDPIADLTLSEDTGPQVVSLNGINSGSLSENQALTVTGVSTNPGLIPAPIVNYSSPNSTGSLLIQPVQNAFGSATITVTVDDGQSENSSISRSFSVTVLAVNDPPYFAPLPDLVLADGTSEYFVQVYGINSGPVNEADFLSLTAISSQPDFVPNPEVAYSNPDSVALLALRPVPGATNTTATITVTLSDGQPLNGTFTRTFSVTIQPALSLPVISAVPDQVIPKNRRSDPIAFAVSDAETPADGLQVSATSSNQSILPDSALILGGSGGNRTLILDPANGRLGTAVITVTVSDGTATASTSFQVTIENR